MELKQWTDERLDKLSGNLEHLTVDVQTLTDDVQKLNQAVQSLTVDVREGFAETRAHIATLTRLATLHQENMEMQQQQFNAAIARMDESIAELRAGQSRHGEFMAELRAGQQRQDAILDYLIRRDG